MLRGFLAHLILRRAARFVGWNGVVGAIARESVSIDLSSPAIR
jgi:hypothetical protein